MKILNGSSYSDYQQLSSELTEYNIDSIDIENIVVSQFISSVPYYACANGDYKSSEDSTTLKYATLFSFYFMKSEGYATINIYISETGKLFVNDKEVSLNKLKKVLLREGKKYDQEEISLDEITVSILASSEVKMGLIADIQQIFREIDWRNVSYSSE